MKFILGLVVGIGGAWLYRAWGQQNLPLSDAPEFVDRGRDTISNVASVAAQQATEIIDKTPIPPQAEDVATSPPSPAEEPQNVASPVTTTDPKPRTRPRRIGAQPNGETGGDAVDPNAPGGAI